jgi:hypothetical protein
MIRSTGPGRYKPEIDTAGCGLLVSEKQGTDPAGIAEGSGRQVGNDRIDAGGEGRGEFLGDVL